MTTLNIGGHKVKVGDEFWSMDQSQQEATIDEIAKSLGAAPAQPQFRADQQGRATRAQRESLTAPIGRMDAVSTGVGQGLTFNSLDEMRGLDAASPLRTQAMERGQQAIRETGLPVIPNPVDMATGGLRMLAEKVAPSVFGRGGNQAYDERVAAERAALDRTQEQRPYSMLAGQVLGGIAQPVPAAAMSSVPRAIGTGAAMGAASGFGGGYGLSDSLKDAGVGAGVGGAIGGVLGRFMQPGVAKPPSEGRAIVEAGERINTSLPRGLVSDRTGVQALTQTLRGQAGGSQVENAVTKSYNELDAARKGVAAQIGGRAGDDAAPNAMSLGERIQGEISAALSQVTGTAERDAARLQGFRGDAPSLQQAGGAVRGRVEANMAENRDIASAPYDAIRGMLPLRGSQLEAAPETVRGVQQGLENVIRSRLQAGERDLPSSLTPALDLVTRPEGVTFNGLQRARQALGEMIDFEAGRGFGTGDLKAVYGQISGAMRDVLERQGGQRAVSAFEAAEQQFAGIQARNSELANVLRGKDEGFITGLVTAAMDKTGANATKFNLLWRELGDAERQTVANAIYGRLGRRDDGAGEFSIDQFAKNWSTMSAQGKSALFGKQAQEIDRLVASAQGSAGRSAEYARDVVKLTQEAPERVVDRLMNAATSGSGEDFGKLARAVTIMGPKAGSELADAFVSQIGVHNGVFSPRRFVSEWGNVPDQAKRLLIPDATQRAALDDIATVSNRLATTYEKFASKSQSNRNVMIGVGSVGGLVEPMTLLGTVVAPAVMSRILSQPASTASAAKWAKAYEVAVMKPTAATATAFDRATKNMAATIGDKAGIPNLADAIMKQVAGGPVRAPADQKSGQQQP